MTSNDRCDPSFSSPEDFDRIEAAPLWNGQKGQQKSLGSPEVQLSKVGAEERMENDGGSWGRETRKYICCGKQSFSSPEDFDRIEAAPLWNGQKGQQKSLGSPEVQLSKVEAEEIMAC